MNDRPFPADPGDWDGEWAPWFLPVVTVGNAWLFADLSSADQDRAPIHTWDHAPGGIFSVSARSWTHVIATWADAIRDGYSTWDATEDRWHVAGVLPHEVQSLL